MNFGVEIFNKGELDVFSRFFIETSTDEKFEITKSPLGGYVIKDITPPEYTMFAKDYRTIELNDIQRQKVLKHNPQYEYINLGNHKDFEVYLKAEHNTIILHPPFSTEKGCFHYPSFNLKEGIFM